MWVARNINKQNFLFHVQCSFCLKQMWITVLPIILNHVKVMAYPKVTTPFASKFQRNVGHYNSWNSMICVVASFITIYLDSAHVVLRICYNNSNLSLLGLATKRYKSHSIQHFYLRRTRHVSWVTNFRANKTHYLPRETTAWTLDSHVISSCSLKPRQICAPAGVKQMISSQFFLV